MSKQKSVFRNRSIWRFFERKHTPTLKDLRDAGYVFVPKADAGMRGNVPIVASHDPMQRLINVMAARGYVLIFVGNSLSQGAGVAATASAEAGASTQGWRRQKKSYSEMMKPVSGRFLTVKDNEGVPAALIMQGDGKTVAVRGKNILREMQRYQTGDEVIIKQTGWDRDNNRRYQVTSAEARAVTH